MGFDDIYKILFPENKNQKAVNCSLLLIFINGIIYLILQKLTWALFLQYYLPISIIVLFVLITWYFVYDFRGRVLRLWYFWLFPVMPFIIGAVAFYLIPNWPAKPPEPPKNLLVVIANFEPVPSTNVEAKENCETIPKDLERMIKQKIASGVPLEYPIMYKQQIEGKTEKEKRKNAKDIGHHEGAHLVLWGSVQFTETGGKGEFYIEPKITVAHPLGPTELEERQPGELRVSLSNPEILELRRSKIEETTDIVSLIHGLAFLDRQDYQGAINIFKEIKNPDAKVSFYHGAVLMLLDLFDEAIRQFDRTLEINPRFAEAYVNRGVAYYYKKEYDKAWEDVHKAQGLGYQVPPEFLKALREASGR